MIKALHIGHSMLERALLGDFRGRAQYWHVLQLLEDCWSSRASERVSVMLLVGLRRMYNIVQSSSEFDLLNGFSRFSFCLRI